MKLVVSQLMSSLDKDQFFFSTKDSEKGGKTAKESKRISNM